MYFPSLSFLVPRSLCGDMRHLSVGSLSLRSSISVTSSELTLPPTARRRSVIQIVRSIKLIERPAIDQTYTTSAEAEARAAAAG